MTGCCSLGYVSRHSEQRGTSVIQNLLTECCGFTRNIEWDRAAVRFLISLRLVGMTGCCSLGYVSRHSEQRGTSVIQNLLTECCGLMRNIEPRACGS